MLKFADESLRIKTKRERWLPSELNTKKIRKTMWKTKIFKSAEARETWYQQNKKKYQICYLFVNNGYGIEYKPLKKY